MKEKVKVIDIFLPWVESIGLVVYCYLVVLFNLKFKPALSVGLLFFLPVAGFELYLSLRYEEKRLLSIRGIGFLLFRMLFLFVFFYVWAVSFLPVLEAPDAYLGDGTYAWIISLAPYWAQGIKLFLYARPGIVTLMLVVLLVSYYLFFLRMRKGRFFTSVFLPWLLLLGLYFIFYTDVFGGVSKKKVERQPDVEIFFSYPTADFKTGRIFDWLHTFRFPRTLQIDEERKKLYLSFGSTYGSLSDFPNLLEIDISTKNYRALNLREPRNMHNVIRDFDFFPESAERMWLTHWGSEFKMYGVSKDNFEVFEEIDIGHHEEIKHWEPYDILYNQKTETVWIANGVYPSLIAYDLKAKRTQVIDLVHPVRYDEQELSNGVEERVCGVGSAPNKIRFSPMLDKIYMLVVADEKRTLIVEFETSPLKLARVIKIPVWAVSMEIDEDNKTLLVTSGFGKQLWEIDLKKFEIIRETKLPFIFFRKFLIDNTNNLLYPVRSLNLSDKSSTNVEKRTAIDTGTSNGVYCLDYLRGRLFLVDRNTGKTYRKYWVGNKPLGLVKFGERIFVASTLGIVEIKPVQ